jgi:hypothetical protein
VPAPTPKAANPAPATPEVQVVGVYEGTHPLDRLHDHWWQMMGTPPPRIYGPGKPRLVGTVAVKVGEAKGPVVLVLMSYEPVVWKVDDPNDAVVQVIASGYYRQTVEGVGKKVPVTLSAHASGDQDSFYAYRQTAERDDTDFVFPNERIRQAFERGREHEREQTKKAYERMVERVKELTGQEVKEFQGQYRGDTFEIRTEGKK